MIIIFGMENITAYLYDARPLMIRDNKEEAFFLNHHGKRLGGQMLMLSVQNLSRRTNDTALQQKEIGLHTLRHSIATHLLANGMSLEDKRFFRAPMMMHTLARKRNKIIFRAAYLSGITNRGNYKAANH